MPEEDTTSIPVETARAPGGKKGSICCYFCCDFRLAVIILAIVGMVLQLINMILLLTVSGVTAMPGIEISSETSSETSDSSAEEDATAESTTGWIAILQIVFISLVGIGFFAFQLCAALWYNVCMLATVVVFNFLNLGYLLYTNINEGRGPYMPIVFTIFFIVITYPIVGLALEIKAGIMNKETYPREKYICLSQSKV